MPEVKAERTSDRDPDEFATLVADFYGIHTWYSGVSDTVPDDARPNTRLCTLATGAKVAEQLVDSGPTFVRYRMLTDATSPLRYYESELRVVAGVAGGAVLTWGATFACDPAMEEPLTANVRATFERGLEDLLAT